MKIAQVDPSLFTWPYDHELAEALCGLGHDTLVFGKALRPGDPRFGDRKLRQHFYTTLAALPTLPRPVERTIKGLGHAGSLWRLWRTLSRWKPDIIHFQWLALPVLDRPLLPRFRRLAPIVYTVHDTQPFNGTPAGLQAVGALDALSRFDRLIVHTAQGADRVRRLAPSIAIAQVPHGLLHDTGVSVSRKPADDKPAGHVTFLIFGLIKPYKGIDVAIQAMSHLSAHARARCRLRIVGKPYMDTSDLVELVRASGMTDRVEFRFEFVPEKELAREIEAADVLLFPYREIEASGVLMAALANEKPIVASSLGLFAEMLRDGEHGFLVPRDDPEALATAMERLIAAPALCRDFSSAVARLRRTIPSWEEIARRTTEVYEEAREDWRRARNGSSSQSVVSSRV